MQYGGRWSKLNKLSAVAVSQKEKPGLYGDGGGLWLQVSKYNTKSWIFRYTIDGKQREMGLGPVHTISLQKARERAREQRELLLEGKDPIIVRNALGEELKLQKASAKTFKDVAQLYVDTHKVTWKNEKHISQWVNTLNSYVYPVFGHLPVADVTTEHIKDVLAPIWVQKNETASRIRGRIENILNWATASGYRKGDNPARWRGHLENLLPKRSLVQKVKHHTALPYEQLPDFLADLRLQEGISARALEFTILTAARTSETIFSNWHEIDFENALWIIPEERMKADREHKVPLSTRALSILREMEAIKQSEYIFAGARPNRPLSQMAMLTTLKRMGHKDITTHGFRSTFKDWVSECTAFPSEVSEMALAHTIENKVEAAYRRGELLEKRKALMEDWSLYCEKSPIKGKVVSIKGVL